MQNYRWIESLSIKKPDVILVRVDYNVPIVDGNIVDTSRIIASIPTIKYLLLRGCVPVLLSHLGRPNGVEDKRYSLQKCVEVLEKLLKIPVIFHSNLDFSTLRKKVREEKYFGGIFLVENVRFWQAEESLSKIDRANFAQSIASVGDFYINDAFSVCHREHATVTNLAQYLPSAGGLLLQKELFSIKSFQKNEDGNKTAMILGGAKIQEKLPIIKHLLHQVDIFLLGGAMSCTFLRAMGVEVGNSLISESHIEECSTLLRTYGEKFVIPQDVVVVSHLDMQQISFPLVTRNVCLEGTTSIEKTESIVDIGPQTMAKFSKILPSYKKIFWNGPMGIIENNQTAKGTQALITILSTCTQQGSQVVIGGGDSLSALSSVDKMKMNSVGYCCMGGGALLKYLSGKELPGLQQLAGLQQSK